MVRYRIYQFINAISMRHAPPLPNEAALLLNQKEFALFQRMTVFDKHHSLTVYLELASKHPNNVHLLKAALLHDIGKGRPSVIHRAALVLAKALIPQHLAGWDQFSPNGFKGQVYSLSQHAEASASFLSLAGSHQRVIELVSHQESPFDADSRLLAEVDSRC